MPAQSTQSTQSEQLGYDTGASGEAQGNFGSVARQLEALINSHNADVRRAMEQYFAEGVSDAFTGKAARWHHAANQVTHIINLVRSTMSENDGIAGTAQARAMGAVDSI
jgi:hypothetical protein